MTEFKREDPRHKVGALVEIVEILPATFYDEAKAADLPVIKAHRVYINGAPVGLITRDNGIVLEVDPREDNATILNLRLMPRQVLVRAVPETPEQTVFAAAEVDDDVIANEIATAAEEDDGTEDETDAETEGADQ